MSVSPRDLNISKTQRFSEGLGGLQMYKLYGTKGTASCAVKAALTEAGAPFEEVEVTTSKKQHLTEEYRQINPRQQVPSLMLPDGSIVTETSAMLLHIADAHPAIRLAPTHAQLEQ